MAPFPNAFIAMSETLKVLDLRRNNLTDKISYIFPSNCGLQTLNLKKKKKPTARRSGTKVFCQMHNFGVIGHQKQTNRRCLPMLRTYVVCRFLSYDQTNFMGQLVVECLMLLGQ